MSGRGARKTGGGAGRIRAKNQEMAAYMAAKGIKRTLGRCPICNGLVAVDRLYAHIAFHPGASKPQLVKRAA